MNAFQYMMGGLTDNLTLTEEDQQLNQSFDKLAQTLSDGKDYTDDLNELWNCFAAYSAFMYERGVKHGIQIMAEVISNPNQQARRNG